MPSRTVGDSPSDIDGWPDPSPHSSEFVDVDGTRLNCLDWGGSGPSLILIHGAYENPHVYDDLAPAFTDSFRVIAYARRGHGRSDMKGPFDNGTLAGDLRQVMDAYGVRKAHLAGHSMGGNEITAMAGLYPDRVDRIVYFDGAYDWGDPAFKEAAKSPPSHVSQDSPEALTSIDAFREDFRKSVPAVEDSSRFEAWMREAVIIQPDGSVHGRMSDSVASEVLAYLTTERRDYSRVRAPALAIYADSFWDIQKGDPTRVAENLAWEQNYLIAFRASSIERVRRELPGAQIMRVNGTHVDLLLTCRNEIVAAMRQFLGPR